MKLTRHGGGAQEPTAQFRRPQGQPFGQDFTSGIRQEMFGPGQNTQQRLPGATAAMQGRANSLGPGQLELQRAAGLNGGGGSVTSAVQEMRRAQGLPIGSTAFGASPHIPSQGGMGNSGGFTNMGPNSPGMQPGISRVAQSLQGQMGQNGQPLTSQQINTQSSNPMMQQASSQQQPGQDKWGSGGGMQGQQTMMDGRPGGQQGSDKGPSPYFQGQRPQQTSFDSSRYANGK